MVSIGKRRHETRDKERDIPSCSSRSSRLKVELSPVVDVDKALVPTSSVAASSKLMASEKAVTRFAKLTLSPSRGRYPWLANVFTMGHGLRTGSIHLVRSNMIVSVSLFLCLEGK